MSNRITAAEARELSEGITLNECYDKIREAAKNNQNHVALHCLINFNMVDELKLAGFKLLAVNDVNKYHVISW